ncbi:MAG TPA: LuxR C-terminal-related transcriptional regulator [Candidatus Elarobacter sp.]|nr:LuxR C-terminal-related transcriptional regulator [Candidatus Elarobacter sp.]
MLGYRVAPFVNTEPPAGGSPLDVARGRAVPQFCIVDDSFKIVYCSGGDLVAGFQLPDDIREILQRLRSAADEEPASSAVGVLSSTQILRLQRLEAFDNRVHYAVFLEKFAVRNSIQRAAERYGLSTRETQVLEGLMMGEGTLEIAGRLRIGVATVHEHIRKIGRKTNVTKRGAIVATVFGLR